MRIFALIGVLFLGLVAMQDEFSHSSERSTKHGRKLIEKSIHNQMESSQEFWNKKAQNVLTSKVEQKLNENKAKNVIIFLGDGMSLPTVAATRMYLGGEQVQLSFDSFPHYGLSKTYCIDKQVAGEC